MKSTPKTKSDRYTINITKPNSNPFFPLLIKVLNLTFNPIAAIAIVNTSFPKKSLFFMSSSGNWIKDPTNEILKKTIKYQGSLM